MIREIKTNKNMYELNPHGSYGFPFHLLYVTLSAYPLGSFNCHWHPELEIVYVQEGMMTYQVNQERRHIRQGDCLIINSNALHSGCMYTDSDCQYIVATFNPTIVYGYEKSNIDINYVSPFLNAESISSLLLCSGHKEARQFGQIMERIGLLYTEQSVCYELLIKSHLCDLWTIIYSEFKERSASEACIAESKQISRLKNSLSFIHEHYTDSISLEDMAASCHISKSEFCRIFKKTLHQTPFEYLLRYRIQKSLPFLISDTYSITERCSESI